MEDDPLDRGGSVRTWALEFGHPLRIVAQDEIGSDLYSTVFLGIDYGAIYGASEPRVFETAVFHQGRVRIVARYATRGQAIAGHARLLEAVQAGKVPGE